MGMSIGVNLVGDITLTVGDCKERCPSARSCSDGDITDASSTAESVYVNCNSGSDELRPATETYTLSMPSAYARSILTEPWAELGGRVNISCMQTGWTAPLVFHTKVIICHTIHEYFNAMLGGWTDVCILFAALLWRLLT